MAINDLQSVGLFTPEAHKLLDELTSSKNRINANIPEKTTLPATTDFQIFIPKEDPASFKKKRIGMPLTLDPKAVKVAAYTPHQSLHYTTINDGYTPIEVRPIQQKLVAVGYDLGNSDIIGVDGVIGPLTRSAIKAFQSEHMASGTYKLGTVGEETYDAIMALSDTPDSPSKQAPITDDMIANNDKEMQSDKSEDVSFWSVLEEHPDGDAISKPLRKQLLSLPQQRNYEAINLDAATGSLLGLVMGDAGTAESYAEAYKSLCEHIITKRISGSGNETELREQWKTLTETHPMAAYILSKSSEWQNRARLKTSTVESVNNFKISTSAAPNILIARNDLVKGGSYFTAESSDGNSEEAPKCTPGFSDMLGFLTQKVCEHHAEQFLTTALAGIYALSDAGKLTPATYDEIFPTEKSLAMKTDSAAKNIQP